MATDFFHVDAVTLRLYYVLSAIEIDSHVVQVARNLASDLQAAGRRFHFFIRDGDTKFTSSFDEVRRAVSIRAIRTPVRPPKANAFAEHCALPVKSAWTTCSCIPEPTWSL